VNQNWAIQVPSHYPRGTLSSVAELERAIYVWLAKWNDQPKPFVWKATADFILDKVRRCKELLGTPH